MLVPQHKKTNKVSRMKNTVKKNTFLMGSILVSCIPQAFSYQSTFQPSTRNNNVARYILSGTMGIAAGASSAYLASEFDDVVDGGGLASGLASIPLTILACKVVKALAPRDPNNTGITTGLFGGSYLTALAIMRKDKENDLIGWVGKGIAAVFEGMAAAAEREHIRNRGACVSVNVGGGHCHGGWQPHTTWRRYNCGW